jgi:predicted phage terminase large subunit-like protein
MAKPISAELVRKFVELFVSRSYDNYSPSPAFHDDIWEACCLMKPKVVIAAPRGHAKSTSVTDAFGLCSALFRQAKNILIISGTEAQAIQFLGDIKMHLTENEDIIKEFEISRLVKESEKEIIVECRDGYQFRFVAKGSEQNLRGTKWRAKRPDLVICDDLESDDQVFNKDRRLKFRRWFQNALLPIGSDDCRFRIVGTVLHFDAMLNRLLKNKMWHSLRFEACSPGFEDLLWPEKFSVERLRDIRDDYKEEGNLQGWAQEYLNNPIPEGDTYFREQDFLPMDDEDRKSHKIYFSAADFAISENERSDYTVIMTVGIDANNFINVIDVRKGRWDSKKIIDELISVQKRYRPEVFTFETEKIDKAIGPFLNDEMRKTGQYLNINKVTPTKSKTMRGKSMQGKMRSGSVKFDENMELYDDLKSELMTITNSGAAGAHDDMWDAFSYIGLTIDEHRSAETEEELEEIEYEDELALSGESSVNYMTGY